MNNFFSRVGIAALFPGFLVTGCALKTGKQVRHEITPLYSFFRDRAAISCAIIRRRIRRVFRQRESRDDME